MSTTRHATMTDAEIDAFLGNGGTAVMSFARDDEPYAIPISFGYDPDGPSFYVRLAYGPESEKRSYVRPNAETSLVVHGETDEGWKSVVATGRLEEVPEPSIDATVVDAVRSVEIPFVDVYERAPRELDFALYRLTVDGLSGRQEASGDE